VLIAGGRAPEQRKMELQSASGLPNMDDQYGLREVAPRQWSIRSFSTATIIHGHLATQLLFSTERKTLGQSTWQQLCTGPFCPAWKAGFMEWTKIYNNQNYELDPKA